MAKEDFKVLSARDHVRMRTGMYLGSTAREEVERFIMGKWCKVQYVPALNKMIDEIIDNAIQQVNDERAKLGAIQNRLDHTVNNLGSIVTNTEASKSRIQDADFAAESAKLAKNQILLQAGTAMLAQANASQQTVLSLLG